MVLSIDTEFMNEVSFQKGLLAAFYITSLLRCWFTDSKQQGHLGHQVAAMNYSFLNRWSSCSDHTAHLSLVP